jgi:hypothetical protein
MVWVRCSELIRRSGDAVGKAAGLDVGTFYADPGCLGYEATKGHPLLCTLRHGRRLADSGKALCPPYIRSPAQLVGLSVMAEPVVGSGPQ